MKKKREYVPVAAEDRKSLKAWAKGAREEVLRPHIAGYMDALERGWRAERDYVDEVCREYHTIFDWQLKDHEEPLQPLPVYDKFALPVVEALEPDQAEEKRVRKEILNSMDARNDPYAILLGKLSGINVPPKARQAFQQYMHESYDTEIAPAVQARWAATRDNLNGDGAAATQKGPNAPFRALVACELFVELSQEEQDALKERAKEEAAAAREEYEKKRKAPPSNSPEDRQRCIDALGAFMSPILRGIQEYTGLHSVAIFGGPMPKYRGELKTVHVAYGRSRDTAPALFPQWAKARFNRDVVGLMHEYLQAAFTAVECTEAALPESSDDPAPGGSKSHKHHTAGDSDDSDSDDDSDDDSDAETNDSDGSASDGGSDAEDEEAVGKGKAKGRAKEKARKARKAEEKKAKKAAQKEAQEREKAGAMGKGKARKGATSGVRRDAAKKRKRRGEGGESDGEGGAKKKRKAATGSEKEIAGEGAGSSKKRKRVQEDEGSAMESGESGDENDSVRGADEDEYEGAAAPKSKKTAAAPLRRSGRKAAKLGDDGNDTEKDKETTAEANTKKNKQSAVANLKVGLGAATDGSNGGAAGEGGVATTAKKKKGGKGSKAGKGMTDDAPESPPKPRGDRPANPSPSDPLPLSSTAARLLGTTTSTAGTSATPSPDGGASSVGILPKKMPPCPDATPQWVEYAYGSLSGVDLGPFFHEAVNAWLELERVQGFKSAGSLPKAKRPDETPHVPRITGYITFGPQHSNALHYGYPVSHRGLLIAASHGA
ncbi:hypothetical protein C8F04DRAFT_1191819 [Mycena alexandri]|uniref:Uncharacterized protein n=1 Tax=Mycena alexandri TaxID=1745969 RepID=A0AAD6SC55_9AGAR|nr:hypothetical protein C8F04DRAFT_1191819 [Mycena alexandri]